MIVWDAIDTLLHPSVAVHVLTLEKEPAQAPGVVTSPNVNVNALPQASLAVAVAKDGVAGQLIVDVVGNDAITGAVIS